MQTALEKCIPEALFTTTDAARGTWSLSLSHRVCAHVYTQACLHTCTHM